ncbi:MAG: RagB/SusD family nutrient uptake outer membrane protein, partial [Duncaniella sp.]|nr:RagB/SusD family nutrient uptake outer membrane protein [Duncaniella sp.]
MKKILLSILTSVGLLGLASCADFTDIKPKGSNLLQSVTDLEMLLNYEYAGIKASQVQLMAGDLYPMENIPTVISLPQTSLTKILTMWDETAHSREQIEQPSNDSHYTQFYYIIGRIANPILMNIDQATGDEALRRQVKCEALVLRAYFHYLLVQKFARAYAPSYAATTRAIPYLYETQDLLETIPQLTLQEVYTNILDDLDLAISLGGLPEEPVNHMRMGLPFAYAVKAMALMSMQR